MHTHLCAATWTFQSGQNNVPSDADYAVRNDLAADQFSICVQPGVPIPRRARLLSIKGNMLCAKECVSQRDLVVGKIQSIEQGSYDSGSVGTH